MNQMSKNPETQGDVIAFLSSANAHPGGGHVEVLQTHGALVFLSGDVAIKIKRSVRYDYMDLSTLELREKMIRRELALNQAIAPKIYKAVIPITREADGRLALDGVGTPVEWVLRMWRFPASDELSVIADDGRLDDALARDLGQSVFEHHTKTPQRTADGAKLILDILDELDRVFADLGDVFDTSQIAQFHAQSRTALNSIAHLLRQRGAGGHIRRCHGDLHLRNLVMLNGKPVPFDALEFDEVLGTCDVLYDLAFLLMDSRHRILGRAANIVLTSYLLAAAENEDAGLATLPLFIAIRAAIRAMVLAQTARATGSLVNDDAFLYLADALAVLSPPEPALVLVGGLSGSGKTAVAQELAPKIGAAPGAVLLSGDTERNALRGPVHQTPLAAATCPPCARAAIHDGIIQRARDILKTGHSVLIDAAFLTPDDREKATEVATSAGIKLHRFWLEAPLGILIDRVTARRGDASGADADLLQAQYSSTVRPDNWNSISAAGTISETAAHIEAALRETNALSSKD